MHGVEDVNGGLGDPAVLHVEADENIVLRGLAYDSLDIVERRP